MVVVYGVADSELRLFKKLAGKFKVFEFNTISDFEDFRQNPDPFTNSIIGKSNDKLANYNQKIVRCELKINELNDGIREADKEIEFRSNGLKKWPNSKNIREQYYSAINRKQRYKSERTQEENKLIELKTNLKQVWEDNKTLSYDIKRDKEKADELANDFELRKLFKGYHGEVEVIEYIKKQFDEWPDVYLINSIDVNAMGKGFSSEKGFIQGISIDHLLVCRKGVFILETKNWKSYDETNFLKIIQQLQKLELVFRSEFNESIGKDKIKAVLLRCSDVDLVEKCPFDTVKLNEFKEYLTNESDKLSHDETIYVLNTILPFLNEQHINQSTKIKLKAHKTYIDTKNTVKSLFKKIGI